MDDNFRIIIVVVQKGAMYSSGQNNRNVFNRLQSSITKLHNKSQHQESPWR